LLFGAILALGCNLEKKNQVTLQLSAAGTCIRTSLACGGELGVFVADSMTNELLESRCVSFAPDAGMALDKLPAVLQDLMPPLRDLPPGRSIVVEVAAYSPTSGKSCPRFDPNAPIAPGVPVPSYFGRSGATMAGMSTSIAVSLQCLPSTCVTCTKFVSPRGIDPVTPAPPADAGAKTDSKADVKADTAPAEAGGGDAKAEVAPAEVGAGDAKPEAAPAEAGSDAKADAGAPSEAGATEAKPAAAPADAAVEAAPPDGGYTDAAFRTINKMLASLSNGQTGCLEEGTYVEDVTFPKGGSSANPITLAASPGARAVLRGVLTIPDTADNVAIVGLVLDGANASKSATPLIRGDRVALRGNEITNAGADCVTLGDPTFGVAKTISVDGNRIHGCKAGVVASFAESSSIVHNFIFDNTGDGVSMFPNGDSILIEHNVIDGNGNGVLFGSDGKVVSINGNVRLNVISHSTGFNVYSMFPMAVGTGNNATMNCLWMGGKGDVVMPMKGFSAKDNVTANPMFVDRAAKDFRLAPGSPCLGMGPLR
jgi:hypothetical protein